jgi:hypothetical protein
MPTEGARAAEYIHMSTEHQQYSIENQQAAIQRFADARSIRIVRSFIDAAKSGVGIQGRDALQERYPTEPLGSYHVLPITDCAPQRRRSPVGGGSTHV